MAVAADSHRDFLIPEHPTTQNARQPMRRAHRDELCLFFCKDIISQGREEVNGVTEKDVGKTRFNIINF